MANRTLPPQFPNKVLTMLPLQTLQLSTLKHYNIKENLEFQNESPSKAVSFWIVNEFSTLHCFKTLRTAMLNWRAWTAMKRAKNKREDKQLIFLLCSKVNTKRSYVYASYLLYQCSGWANAAMSCFMHLLEQCSSYFRNTLYCSKANVRMGTWGMQWLERENRWYWIFHKMNKYHN